MADYSNIENPYNDLMERGGQVTEDLDPQGSIGSPSQLAPQVISNNSFGNVWISKWIKSTNYKPRVRGFLIDGVKGLIDAVNIYIKGTITGSTIQTSENDPRIVLDADHLIATDDAGNTIFEIKISGSDVGDVIIGDYAGDQGLLYDKSAAAIKYKNLEWSEVTDDDGNKPDDNATVGGIFGTNISGGGTANTQSGNDGYVTLFREDKFGDGSDGTVVISSNTTLTSDMYYENLTISNNAVLKPGGYRIFVRTLLTIESGSSISAMMLAVRMLPDWPVSPSMYSIFR